MPPTDTTQRDPSTEDAKKDTAHTVPASVGFYGANKAETLESGWSKLEMLFDHPLFCVPHAPIPEEDWLMKVKPKIRASKKSSMMWSV